MVVAPLPPGIKVLNRAYDRLLKIVHITVKILAPVNQIYNGVAHDLPRPMVRYIATPVREEYLDTMLRKYLLRNEDVV